MYSAFSMLVYLNGYSHRIFNERAMCSQEKYQLRISIIIVVTIIEFTLPVAPSMASWEAHGDPL